MIEAQQVSVTLGRWPILRGIDFAAQAGDVSVILGPNGSGKTTLLKALCNDHSYNGSIVMNGRELQDIPAREIAHHRAVLPQASVLTFPFTVREVVVLGLTGGNSGVQTSELRHLPERALEAVDMHGFGGRFYAELSGGEQQRVQLARVLCQVWKPVLNDVPRFLMLDEPVSSLDIKHQLQILQIARDFANAGGGVIAVLHDLNLAAMYADHITVLKDGKVCSSGAPVDVLNDTTIGTSFECALKVGALPAADMPFVLPQSSLSESPK